MNRKIDSAVNQRSNLGGRTSKGIWRMHQPEKHLPSA